MHHEHLTIPGTKGIIRTVRLSVCKPCSCPACRLEDNYQEACVEIYLDIALIITSIALIISVILQSKGAGLGGLTGGDSGSIFTARRGVEKADAELADVDVDFINAAPAHPQTLGKLERFHLKEKGRTLVSGRAIGQRIGVAWVATFGSATVMVLLLGLTGPLSGAVFVFAVAAVQTPSRPMSWSVTRARPMTVDANGAIPWGPTGS